MVLPKTLSQVGLRPGLVLLGRPGPMTLGRSLVTGINQQDTPKAGKFGDHGFRSINEKHQSLV